MRREAVEDFLNVQGIASVALIDGRSRSYFYGIENVLNFQQRETLAHAIRHVVEKVPDNFGSLELQFSGTQVYIYKLNNGLILFVMAQDGLVYPIYSRSVARFKADLEQNAETSIEVFRLMSTSRANNGRAWISPELVGGSSVVTLPEPAAPLSPLAVLSKPGQIGDDLTLQDAIAALNQLGELSTHYLGRAVTAGYLKRSRPDGAWIDRFQIDRSARIEFMGTGADLAQGIEADHQRLLQKWVTAVVDRCAHVIRDFPRLVEELAEPAKATKPPAR
jgi:hypothetical protein